MPKSIIRTYSRYSRDAAILIGVLIRNARKEQQFTAQEIADRAGISRGLLQRIEKGEMTCEMGAVFEVATLLNIKLFDADETMLKKQIGQTKEKIALLPMSIRKTKREIDDNF